jgi:hypothetical protein
MKKILFYIVILTAAFTTNVQSQDKFKFNETQFGNYRVTPVFEQSKGIGTKGFASVSDGTYLTNLHHEIIEKSLSKQKQEQLHAGSAYLFTFNKNGEILTCNFILSNRDKNVLSQEDLYLFYRNIKELKLDMSKIKIVPFPQQSKDQVLDYCEFIGTLTLGKNP